MEPQPSLPAGPTRPVAARTELDSLKVNGSACRLCDLKPKDLLAAIASFLALRSQRRLACVSRLWRDITRLPAALPPNIELSSQWLSSEQRESAMDLLASCRARPRSVDLDEPSTGELGELTKFFTAGGAGALTRLNLCYGYSMADQDRFVAFSEALFVAIPESSPLASIELSGCAKISNHNLVSLARLPITALSLDQCRLQTDFQLSIAKMGSLTTLTVLQNNFRRVPLILTATILQPLANLHLSTLHAVVDLRSAECSALLVRFPLTDLALTEGRFFPSSWSTNAMLAQLKPLKLRSLALKGFASVTNDNLGFVADMPLERISLMNCTSLTSDCFLRLTSLDRLRSLTTNVGLDLKATRNIAKLPITDLTLVVNRKVDRKLLGPLAQMDSLRSVYLGFMSYARGVDSDILEQRGVQVTAGQRVCRDQMWN